MACGESERERERERGDKVFQDHGYLSFMTLSWNAGGRMFWRVCVRLGTGGGGGPPPQALGKRERESTYCQMIPQPELTFCSENLRPATGTHPGLNLYRIC